jgi:hypothetical protein
MNEESLAFSAFLAGALNLEVNVEILKWTKARYRQVEEHSIRQEKLLEEIAGLLKHGGEQSPPS